MKNVKKMLVALVVVLACVCTVVLAACGGEEWPASYEFKGVLRMTTSAGESSADTTLSLKEDGTLELAVINNGNTMAKWEGTWKQNKDGTVEITFSAKAPTESLMEGFSLNDADVEAGGMGGLTITTEINENNVNSFTVRIILDLSGYAMPLEIPMTQVVEEAAE